MIFIGFEERIPSIMNLKKIIIGLVIFIFMVFVYLFVYKKNDVYLEVSMINFTESIEQGSLVDINLTIYYTSPFMFSSVPVSIEWLREGRYNYKIVIEGYVLQEYVDLLQQVDDVKLIPVRNERIEDVRIYYIFENQKSGETFSVAIWAYRGSVLVNGVNIAEHSIFYEVIVPFLPESEREVIEKEIQRINMD